MRTVWFWTTAVVALTCVSCGNGLCAVSGKVTYQGEPAVGAAVHFRRQGVDPLNEHLVMGIVQADGSFTLDCGPLGKGAPVGEYDVLIEWRRGSTPGKGGAQKPPDWLKGRYADPKHSLFHATIKEGGNTLPPFELRDE